MTAPRLIPFQDTNWPSDAVAGLASRGSLADYRQVLAQILDGHAWLFLDEDEILHAAVGLWPFEGRAVAWFACLPSLRSHLRRFVREARIVLGAQAAGEFGLPSPTVTVVIPGHAPGERLARLLGFEATGRMVHDYQLWEMAHDPRA